MRCKSVTGHTDGCDSEQLVIAARALVKGLLRPVGQAMAIAEAEGNPPNCKTEVRSQVGAITSTQQLPSGLLMFRIIGAMAKFEQVPIQERSGKIGDHEPAKAIG